MGQADSGLRGVDEIPPGGYDASQMRTTRATTTPKARRRARARRAVSMRQIQAVVDQIARQFSPRKVILFGSHARGRAGPDSDVDLLVVTDKPTDADSSLRILRAIDYGFSLDLVVCDEARLRRRILLGDFFLMDVTEQGKALYERTDR
jgi:predicted nucleotidyltransferase